MKECRVPLFLEVVTNGDVDSDVTDKPCNVDDRDKSDGSEILFKRFYPSLEFFDAKHLQYQTSRLN